MRAGRSVGVEGRMIIGSLEASLLPMPELAHKSSLSACPHLTSPAGRGYCLAAARHRLRLKMLPPPVWPVGGKSFRIRHDSVDERFGRDFSRRSLPTGCGDRAFDNKSGSLVDCSGTTWRALLRPLCGMNELGRSRLSACRARGEFAKRRANHRDNFSTRKVR